MSASQGLDLIAYFTVCMIGVATFIISFSTGHSITLYVVAGVLYAWAITRINHLRQRKDQEL